MKIYQVDSFTDVPFKGNPAAVCLLESERPDAWMLGVSAEMNLSETAFLRPRGERFSLRWLTPATEVTLCGHATLAAAHVLWQEGMLAPGAAALFDTLSGPLTARKTGTWIEMDFPVRRVAPCAPMEALNRALGAAPRATFARESAKGSSYLLELSSEAEVAALSPDFRSLRALGRCAVIVTAPSTRAGVDFVSRFFAPAIGIDEDPVTGSAHCSLAPFWAARLGKSELVGFQASARTGVVGCSPRGERVLLRGQAVTTLRGELTA